MRRRTILISFFATMVHGVAHAGAWGHDSFENDGALDWLDEFLDKPSPEIVAVALSAAVKVELIDTFEGQCAIAAAEVVAALLGRPATNLPKPLAAWLRVADRTGYKNLKKLAGSAVNAVLTGKNSELRESWSLHQEDLNLWQENGFALAKRLR